MTAAAIDSIAPGLPAEMHDAAGVVLASASLARGRWCAVQLGKRFYEGPAAPLRSLDRLSMRAAVSELAARGALDVRSAVHGRHCTGVRLASNVGALELQARPLPIRIAFRDERKRYVWPKLDDATRAEALAINRELCAIFDALQSHTITLARTDVEAIAITLRDLAAGVHLEHENATPLRYAGGPEPGVPPGGARPLFPSPLPSFVCSPSDAAIGLGPVSEMLATAGEEIDLRPWLQPTAVYNRGSLAHGGRVYRLAPQNWPAAYRGRIRIDGEAVAELDFPSLHPRMLCDAASIDAPADFYSAIDATLPRRALKIAANALWCAESLRDVLGVIEHAQREHGSPTPRLAALQLVRRFAETYPALVPFAACGVGLALQNVDGAIARRVMLELRDVGCIGVHDSFIVPTRAVDRLGDTMAAELARGIESGRDRLRRAASNASARDLLRWLDEQIEHEQAREDWHRLALEDREGAFV